MAPMALVGVTLMSADEVRYAGYLAPASELGLSAVGDQQLAGAIMWVGGKFIMLVAIFWLGWMALCREERRQAAREAYEDRGAVAAAAPEVVAVGAVELGEEPNGVLKSHSPPAAGGRQRARATVGATDLAAGFAGLTVAMTVLETAPRQAVGAFLVSAALIGLTLGRRLGMRGQGPGAGERAPLLARVAVSWTLTAVGVLTFANAGAAAGPAAGLGVAGLWRAGVFGAVARRVRRKTRRVAREAAGHPG